MTVIVLRTDACDGAWRSAGVVATGTGRSLPGSKSGLESYSRSKPGGGVQIVVVVLCLLLYVC